MIVNDENGLTASQMPPLVVNGGSISVSGFFLDLEAGSRIDASGGVAIAANGKQTAGNGGSIAIRGATDSQSPRSG